MFVTIKDLSFQIDPEDWDRLKCRPWRVLRNNRGRIVVTHQTRRDGKVRNHYIQHEILGEIPDGMVIDHINGDPADHRRHNLRICSRQQNGMNRRPTAKSGFKGVCWRSGKFEAGITFGGVRKILGRFADPVEAAAAYNDAAARVFGEYAWLNPLNVEQVAVTS